MPLTIIMRSPGKIFEVFDFPGDGTSHDCADLHAQEIPAARNVREASKDLEKYPLARFAQHG
jgi:hypothetical protein